jgi:hypothetical protein
VGAQHVLDLGAEHLVADAIDHVFAAVEHPEVARRVDLADVARAPEAGDERSPGRGVVGEVARHHHRPLDPDLARFARRHLAPGLVHNPHLGTRHHPADAFRVKCGVTERH